MRGDGVELAILEEGAGPAVLLLHGFPDTSAVWRHQLPALTSAGLRAIAPDLRGRGASERPATVEDYGLGRRVPLRPLRGDGRVIEVIRQFFGTNRIRFDLVSPAALGFVRPIENLQQVNRDCIDARVWEGVYFRTGDRVAESLGRRIGHYTFHHAMRAAPGQVFRGAWRGGDAHQDDAVDRADRVE